MQGQHVVCKHCVATKGETARNEVEYRDKKDGVFLCQEHRALLIAVGINIDRFQRLQISTHRPFAENKKFVEECEWRKHEGSLTENPALWTHKPGNHRKMVKGNVNPYAGGAR